MPHRQEEQFHGLKLYLFFLSLDKWIHYASHPHAYSDLYSHCYAIYTLTIISLALSVSLSLFLFFTLCSSQFWTSPIATLHTQTLSPPSLTVLPTFCDFSVPLHYHSIFPFNLSLARLHSPRPFHIRPRFTYWLPNIESTETSIHTRTPRAHISRQSERPQHIRATETDQQP